MKRALSLVRVSTANQEDNTSLEAQEKANENYCLENGIIIADVCRIVHSGADVFNAPEFQPFLIKLKSDAYDAIIIHELDRLSRDIDQTFALKYLFKTYNVELHFVKDNFDDSPSSKAYQFFKMFSAEEEKRQTRDRTMRGKLHKLQKGEFMPAVDLFGYKFNRTTKKREIVEVEAEIIREIFARLIKGESLNKIYKDFNLRGIPAPSATRRTYKDNRLLLWHRTALMRIRDEIQYTGKTIAHRKQSITFYEHGKRKTKLVPVPADKQIHLPDGITPQIITPEDFALANKISKANVGDETRNAKTEYLFRGRVFCAECGKKMYADANKTRKMYRCSTRTDYRVSQCAGKASNATYVDKFMWQMLKFDIRHPNKLKKEITAFEKEKGTKNSKTQNQQTEINKQIAKLDSELNNLVSRSASADAETWKIFESQIKSRQTEKQILQDKLKEFNQISEAQTTKAKSLLELVQTVQDKIEDADFTLQTQIIKAFDAKVFANGKNIELVWKVI